MVWNVKHVFIWYKQSGMKDLLFFFSSSAVFKNVKVQKIYEVVFAEVGKSTALPKWITRF